MKSMIKAQIVCSEKGVEDQRGLPGGDGNRAGWPGKGSDGKSDKRLSSVCGWPPSPHKGPGYFSHSHRHVSRCDWSTFVPGLSLTELDYLSLIGSSPNSASSHFFTLSGPSQLLWSGKKYLL